MSENCRDILKTFLAFLAVLGVGLLVGQLVLKLQRPETPAKPFGQVLAVHQ